MKKLVFIILLIGSFAQAQYSIKGTMHPPKKYAWALLYKLEGARQTFVKNSKIEKELQTQNGKTRTVGVFKFELEDQAETGMYRVIYDLQQNRFVDFIFNKENIDFEFNPGDAENTLFFDLSEENKVYRRYLYDISTKQYIVDSLQVAYLKSPNPKIEKEYKLAVLSLDQVQQGYNKASAGMFAHEFVKATDRYNSPQVSPTSQDYLNGVVNHFYDKIDFNNKNLLKSSFLVDRVADYVFYMNYSQDPNIQESLHKKAVDVSLAKIENTKLKVEVIQFLISQFAALKNATVVEYIIENHFDKIPIEYQTKELRDFKSEMLASLSVAIGKIAPDFSWTENGKNMSLSSLNDGLNYLLIFYSTTCSHCEREVPQIFEFLKDKNKTKVVAFAMETEPEGWNVYKAGLPGWHHVLGLNKWENKIARKYQINSTPTYFVLGMDKKIIANPETIDELKMILKGLN